MRVAVLGLGYARPTALLLLGLAALTPLLLRAVGTDPLPHHYTAALALVAAPLLALGAAGIRRARNVNALLRAVARDIEEGAMGEEVPEGWVRGAAVLWYARDGGGMVLREGVALRSFAAVASRGCGLLVAPALWRETPWGRVVVLRLACRSVERVEGRLQVLDPRHGAATASILLSRGAVEGRVELRGRRGSEAVLSLVGELRAAEVVCGAEVRLAQVRGRGMEAFRLLLAPEEAAVVGLEGQFSIGEALRVLRAGPPYIACMGCGEYRARLRLGSRLSELRLLSIPCGV